MESIKDSRGNWERRQMTGKGKVWKNEDEYLEKVINIFFLFHWRASIGNN